MCTQPNAGESIVARTREIKSGDPADISLTTMSAVINQKAFKTKSTTNHRERAQAKVGRVLARVARPDGEQGFFVEPTVIARRKPGDTIEQEEIFGPVLAVIRPRVSMTRAEDCERHPIRLDRGCLHR